jgi:hypothetical protein
MTIVNRAALISALLTTSSIAAAEPGFARPPDEPLVVAEGESRPDPEPFRLRTQNAFVRASVGPALRVSDAATDGGLYAAVDLGARATGLRLSGAWMRAGADQGLSQYSAELFIDFGTDKLLHPQLAAGAGLARVGTRNSAGGTDTTSLGVGVLRGSLEYLLPISAEDARMGIDVIGSVPAIRGSDGADAKPWLLAAARVGIGF